MSRAGVKHGQATWYIDVNSCCVRVTHVDGSSDEITPIITKQFGKRVSLAVVFLPNSVTVVGQARLGVMFSAAVIYIRVCFPPKVENYAQLRKSTHIFWHGKMTRMTRLSRLPTRRCGFFINPPSGENFPVKFSFAVEMLTRKNVIRVSGLLK